MARAHLQLRDGQGFALLQAGEVKPVSLRDRRLTRSLTIVFALAVAISLALFGLRSYAQNMTANHSHPELDPASWPDSSLTIPNLSHAPFSLTYSGPPLA